VLFANDPKLEAAAVSNPAHIFRGASGPHVSKVQRALFSVDDAVINKSELTAKFFGETTENAVLDYKRKRNIVNTTYEKDVDPIVGVMTMASLDKEMVKFEASLDEITILSALATVLGYSPEQQIIISDTQPLRQTVKTMQNSIKK
jgi:hypothetical protein